MKIVLIETKIPGPHILEIARYPRVGLPIIGTIIKKETKHEVIIFAEEVAPINWQEVLEADVVGFSLLTAEAPSVYRYAKWIKERKKNIIVIMGGPHVTFCSEEALNNGADFVVHHEGEPVIIPLLEAIENGSGFGEIHNLSFRKKRDEIVHNNISPTAVDLDDYPLPDPSLIRGWGKRKSSLFSQIIPLETSRGCPFDCDFCCVHPQFGRRTKFRNNEAVAEYIKQQGARHFFFVDDNFLINPERVATLMELFQKKKIKARFNSQIGVKSILNIARNFPEILEQMREIGFGRQFIGAESINNSTLKQINKNQSREEIEEALSILQNKGILVHPMFMMGNDLDTVNTIWETLEFCKKMKVDSTWFSIITPYPGTRLIDKVRDRIIVKNWRYYDAAHSVYAPLQIKPAVLHSEVLKAMINFYSLPRIFTKGKSNLLPGFIGWITVKAFKKESERYLREVLSKNY